MGTELLKSGQAKSETYDKTNFMRKFKNQDIRCFSRVQKICHGIPSFTTPRSCILDGFPYFTREVKRN